MTIFIAADHRGFEFKNKIVEYLQQKNIRVEDMGPYEYDPVDDYPDFAFKVAQAIRQNPSELLGIVICGSGAGVSAAANRNPGVICGLGFNIKQVKHMRENDHANVLALPSDYIDFDTATSFINTFLEAVPKTDEKYLRRARKLDEVQKAPPEAII